MTLLLTIGQVAKQCGVGVETGREDDSPFFGCRTYTVGGKTVGVPLEKWLVEALRR
jgi:hypothetical protein